MAAPAGARSTRAAVAAIAQKNEIWWETPRSSGFTGAGTEDVVGALIAIVWGRVLLLKPAGKPGVFDKTLFSSQKRNNFAGPFVGQQVPNLMSTLGSDLSLPRRGAALASMLGAAGCVAWESIHFFRIEWLGVAWAAMLAAGGLGITSKHLTLQTLSRGMAWLMALPFGIVFTVSLFKGYHHDWSVPAMFLTTASALFFSSPALHTKSAVAQFHPFRFRRTLLAGSTATAATAFLTGGLALEQLGHRSIASGLGFGFLTAVLLAISTAVVRMRAWGILLGTATSAILLAISACMHNDEGFALGVLTLPMMLLHLLPILWARWGAAGTGVRVGSSTATALESAPVRYRVASLEDPLDAAIDADREELPQERRHVHV